MPLLRPPPPPQKHDEVDAAAFEVVMYGLAGRFADRVHNWVQSAPIDDLLVWRSPPSLNQLPKANDLALVKEPNRADRALWVLDRFTVTYEADWHLASLHSEWLWLLGQSPGPCPADVMQHRLTRAHDIARCIADAHTGRQRDGQRSGPASGGISAAAFVGPAADSLRAGRTSDALAVFRALLRIRPNDPEINNNYGFCLLADEPSSALDWLKRAADLREDPDATNLANRAFAFSSLGQYQEVLMLADELWHLDEEAVRPAFLWLEGSDGRPVLGEDLDPRLYIARLAQRAAEELGHESELLWRGRAD